MSGMYVPAGKSARTVGMHNNAHGISERFTRMEQTRKCSFPTSDRRSLSFVPACTGLKSSKTFTALLVVGFFACLSLIYVLSFDGIINSYKSNDYPRLKSWTSADNQSDSKFESYSSTCILPSIDPWNDEIIQHFEALDGLNSDCANYNITELKNGVVIVKEENTNCWSKCVEYINDFKVQLADSWIPAGVKMDCDVILTHCSRTNSLDNVHHAEIHIQIAEKKTSMQTAEQNDSKDLTNTKKHDVLIIVIDSVGMTQAERIFLKTLTYMRNHMNAITVPHVNKIGLNTYPNGMPFITGIQINKRTFRAPVGTYEIERKCFPHYLDNTTHLFKVFNEHGYKTMLADNWISAVFYPDCLGFKTPPTDHNLNPVYRLIESKEHPFVKDNCFIYIPRMLDYQTEFLNTYEDVPKFSMIWDSVNAHNTENGGIKDDSPLLNFLVKNRKKLDESFIIFMSDHGLRFGQVAETKTGAIENNNPLLTIALPKDVRHNTELLETLKTNAKNLQTIWDIRATLFDILQSQSTGFSDFSPVLFEKGFGSSLFRRQEGVRNCKTLPIPLEFCLCDLPREELSPNTTEMVQLGTFAIDEINNIIEKNNLTGKCHQWKFVEIRSAVRVDGELYEVQVNANSKAERSAIFKGHTNGRDRLLLCHETITPAVQQGMVHKDPDVDAIYRLLNADRNSGLTKRFNRFAPAITLESGTYAPWNSQNTLFNRKAFFTMMLPTTVEFRVTDIWRSFFSQKMLHLIGEEVAFYPANAVQFRNAHDYLEDFDDERAVYLKSGEIIEFIHGWECFESTTSDCVLALAAEFRNRGFIDDADVSMYSAWIDDLTSIGYHFPPLVNVSRIYDDDSVNTVQGNCRAAGLELVTDMTENKTEPQMERARQKMENFGDLLEWCGGENHNFTEHDKNTERSFFSPSQLAVLHSKMENLTNKHETVLLVTFNYPMRESIGVLQRLYEPFFALTVFCGSWNPNTYNYGEALPGIKFPLNFIYLSEKEMLRGYFAYYCLSKINDMRLQTIKGFYAISDDVVFNIWNGTPLDKVVQAGGFAGSPGGEFWWRTKWGPKAALKSVSLFEQKYANDSKVQEIWSEAQRRVLSKNISSSAQELLTTFTGHTKADFFYIPQYELNFLAGMIEIFREAEYFHELVSTKLMELASEKSLRMPNFASLWGKRRNIWDNIYSSDLIMLHPVKLSQLKNNLGKKKLCRTIIGTFRENLYP